MTVLRTIHGISEDVACALGLLLNLLLIYSIRKANNVELKKYSRILLQSTFVDLVFLAIVFVAKPIVIIWRRTGFYLVNIPIEIPLDFKFLLADFYTFMLFCSPCTTAISFYYRYTVLCLNKPFSLLKQLCYLFGLGVLGIGYMILSLFYLYLRPKERLGIAEELQDMLANGNGKVDAVLLADPGDPYTLIVIGYAAAFTFGSYLVEVWCSWKIYKYLKLFNFNSNSRIKEIQNQITKTLIAQAIFPLLTFTVPMSFLIVNVMSPIEMNPEYSFFAGFIFAYYPTLNACSALLFVKQYRKNISKLAKGYCNIIFPGTCSISTVEGS
ncbi:hypothetical protein FO519_001741 [Halicephalobus sp. NKZ332]|nr:hypothetical protein FO519_001741 [Halicephalobus sp. NKZ332]